MHHFARRFSRLILLAATAVIAVAPAAGAQSAADVSSHPWIGRAAPEFALNEVGGGAMKLEDLRGKYVVIHFGASW